MGTILQFPTLRSPQALRRALGGLTAIDDAGHYQACEAVVKATGERGVIAGIHRKSGHFLLLNGTVLSYHEGDALEVIGAGDGTPGDCA